LIFLAPLIPTALFGAFLAQVVYRGSDLPDVGSKGGSVADRWRNKRRRLLRLVVFYSPILYAGGVVGAAIADRSVETSFWSLSLASVIGQLGALTMISAWMSLRRFWWTRRL